MTKTQFKRMMKAFNDLNVMSRYPGVHYSPSRDSLYVLCHDYLCMRIDKMSKFKYDFNEFCTDVDENEEICDILDKLFKEHDECVQVKVDPDIVMRALAVFNAGKIDVQVLSNWKCNVVLDLQGFIEDTNGFIEATIAGKRS